MMCQLFNNCQLSVEFEVLRMDFNAKVTAANLLWSWAERAWESLTNVSIFPTGNLRISIPVTLEFFIFCLIRHNIQICQTNEILTANTNLNCQCFKIKDWERKDWTNISSTLDLDLTTFIQEIYLSTGSKKFIYSSGKLIFILNYLLSSGIMVNTPC